MAFLTVVRNVVSICKVPKNSSADAYLVARATAGTLKLSWGPLLDLFSSNRLPCSGADGTSLISTLGQFFLTFRTLVADFSDVV